MHAPIFDAVSALGIAGIALAMAGVAVWLCVRYAGSRLLVAVAVVAAWMLVTADAAVSGRLARFDLTPPPMALLLAAMFAAALAIGLSSLGRRLATAVPLAVLIGVQMFRLPLELVMHHAAERGIMPAEMSFTGYNFDIVTGGLAVALFAGLRVRPTAPRRLIWAWNLWGLWCLAVIAWVAVATSPMVRAFGDDAQHLNTWVLYFPYVWLPAVLVVIALAGHIVLTRALLGHGLAAQAQPIQDRP